jgi:hypothetical protein
MKEFKCNLMNYSPTKPARKTNTSGLSLAGTGAVEVLPNKNEDQSRKEYNDPKNK